MKITENILCDGKEEGGVPEKELAELLTERDLTFATAESCTGGRIAASITALPGCSVFYRGGIVAYSNEMKEQFLGVSSETLTRHGAVSEQTVCEMVRGAMYRLGVDCAVGTSGIAGPGGGTSEKPVGTIWIAAAFRNEIRTFKQSGDEGRSRNVLRATRNALRLLTGVLKEEK